MSARWLIGILGLALTGMTGLPEIASAATLSGDGKAADPDVSSKVSVPAMAPEPLRAVAEFAKVGSKRDRSIALFQEAGKVIQHPRCVNCHPRGDTPRQGDERRLHQPLVVRGADGHGAVGMQCTTCHGSQNFDPAGVPGHPLWHVAPASMTWEGKTLGEICEQIKDPKRNGNLSLEKLVHHFAEDTLVGWAWNPGGGRLPAPGTQKGFGELIQAWVDSGAVCPKS